MTRALILASLLALTAPACVSEDSAGQGSVHILAGGGQALREGFPHVEGGVIPYAFIDGWELSFERFIVSIGGVELSRPATGAVEASWDGGAVVDLMRQASAQRRIATIEEVPARRLDFAFRTAVADPAAELVDADADDVAEMAANGWSLLFEGTATRGAEVVVFRVGLPALASYRRCANGNDGTQGIAVQANRVTEALLSSHVVHIFWDSLLGSAELRFDAWAAVAGDDGVVTEAELLTQSLFDLKGLDGGPLVDANGNRIFYDDSGLLPAGQTSLADFVRAGAALTFHLNGLGYCDYTLTQ